MSREKLRKWMATNGLWPTPHRCVQQVLSAHGLQALPRNTRNPSLYASIFPLPPLPGGDFGSGHFHFALTSSKLVIDIF